MCVAVANNCISCERKKKTEGEREKKEKAGGMKGSKNQTSGNKSHERRSLPHLSPSTACGRHNGHPVVCVA